jgi:CheY-like chemotaxis protein
MADRKEKILVVEDNAALSGVICFNLVRAGFDVTSANNGRAGLETLKKGNFDLRQLPAHRKTPFILLTAKCMEIDLPKLQQQPGVSTALPKPFSPSELISCIEECLAAGCRS